MTPHVPIDKVELIGRSFPFGELDESVRAALASICRWDRRAAGEVIFRQGDPGTSMVVILSGSVRVVTSSAEGKRLALAILGEGQVVGEMALLEGGIRSADVITEEPTELLVLERRDLIPFLEHNPRICIMLLEVLSGRLRQTTETLSDRTFLSLEARLAKALLRLADAYGRETADGVRIEMKLSQRAIGEMIGASRESVNKQLQAWSDEGIVQLKRGNVAVLQLEGLTGIAGLH